MLELRVALGAGLGPGVGERGGRGALAARLAARAAAQARAALGGRRRLRARRAPLRLHLAAREHVVVGDHAHFTCELMRFISLVFMCLALTTPDTNFSKLVPPSQIYQFFTQ